MSYNSRPASTANTSSRTIGHTNGNRTPRKKRKFCTHGVPKVKCKKKHGDDGSDMAGGAMA